MIQFGVKLLFIDLFSIRSVCFSLMSWAAPLCFKWKAILWRMVTTAQNEHRSRDFIHNYHFQGFSNSSFLDAILSHFEILFALVAKYQGTLYSHYLLSVSVLLPSRFFLHYHDIISSKFEFPRTKVRW